MNRRTGLIGLVLLLAGTRLLGSDVSGIWIGQQQGRNGEPEDVAFRFKVDRGALTGKMFGDEFDLAIQDGSISGEQVAFVVVSTNYYNGTKVKFRYTGTLKDGEMELVRERVATQDAAANRPVPKQTIKLKRLT